MKKNILLSVIFCTSTLFAQAQSVVSFDNNPLNASGQPTAVSIDGVNNIKNLTNDTLKLVWKAVIIATQPGWVFSICDVNSCWAPTVVTKFVTLLPNQSGRMNLDLQPNGKKGVGQGEIRLSLQSSPAVVIATGVYNFSAETNSTSDIDASRISVYPNPATEYFKLNDPSDNIAKISFMNVLGREVRSFYATEDDTYNISDLPSGIYLVRLSDRNNRIIKTMRISKKQP